jgi:hypothetical protein
MFSYILFLALYLCIISVTIAISVSSLTAGLFVSVFIGIFSVVKNCVIGIQRSVTNAFMKVTLYTTVGFAVLCMAAFVIFFVVMVI